MLLSLKIENFALIDRLDLELHPGLNILTGETGAGKSIILDALDAALGGKISGRSLRTGTSRAIIEAAFSMNGAILAWLQAEEIDTTENTHGVEELICSREITARQNRTRINGVVVNKQQIQSIRELLLEITAQGQTVGLGQASMQRDWLDLFGGSEILAIRTKVGQRYETWRRSHGQLVERISSDRQRLQQLDILQFQLQELEAAQLGEPDELEQLERENLRLCHSVDLARQGYEVYEMLYQNDAGLACADLLGNAEAILQEMLEVDQDLAEICELVSSALAQVEEAGREINAYASDLETDPARLQVVEERIRLLKQICRKYGANLGEAIAHMHKLQHDLGDWSDAEQSLEALGKQVAKDQKALQQACQKLHELRQQAAEILEKELIAVLKSLAMAKVQFQVQFAAIEPSATGSDRLTFMFSANPGEPLQALSETASGGEMSRFLLALKACLAQQKQGSSDNFETANTLVFDEIDVGVSGKVAQAIASQLYQLSRQSQVLCVTHQPIIAAIADHHFQVAKQVTSADDLERTSVQVNYLTEAERRQELAQLAGGITIDTQNLVTTKKKGKATPDPAIAFAETLLAQAASLKAQLGQHLSP